MQIFISWSGPTSQQIAVILRRWIQDVFPSISAWMSAGDIEPGSLWNTRLVDELNKSSLGILCLTQDSLDAPWMIFEAGWLAKTAGVEHVVPYLFQLSTTDVKYPLAMFQSVEGTQEGSYGLVKKINKVGNLGIPIDRLEKLHTRMWPELSQALTAVGPSAERVERKRSDRELVEEILVLVRDSSRRTSPYPFRPIGREECLVLNLRPLLPERGSYFLMEYQPTLSVSSLIDRVYFVINEFASMPAYQYGSLWILQDEVRGKCYDDIGIEYCRTKGEVRDDRSISSVGILPGDRLAVVPYGNMDLAVHRAEPPAAADGGA